MGGHLSYHNRAGSSHRGRWWWRYDQTGEDSIKRFDRIVILTGAGLSADAANDAFPRPEGVWAKVDPEHVATPEAFARDPDTVLGFYAWRRDVAASVKPNPAHKALARLEKHHTGTVTLITRNIDTLHARAGTRNLIHMHGRLDRVLCNHCGARQRWARQRPPVTQKDRCPKCYAVGKLRPDVVWFGEMPNGLDRVTSLIDQCDLFVSIGADARVYPAARLVELARRSGAYTIALDDQPSADPSAFHEAIHGPLSVIVPGLVSKLLAVSDEPHLR